MIYCADCGASLPNESKFCFNCGMAVAQLSADVNPEPTIQAKLIVDLPSKILPIYETKSSADEKNTSSIKEVIYCRNCGNTLNPNAFACNNCGLPPSKGKNNCQCCGASTHPEAIICVKCGVLLAAYSDKKITEIEAHPTIIEQPTPQHITPTSYTQQNITIIGKQKSVGIAFLLAFLFGPLGRFNRHT